MAGRFSSTSCRARSTASATARPRPSRGFSRTRWRGSNPPPLAIRRLAVIKRREREFMTEHTEAPPPQAVVLQMLTGMWVAQILSAVAQLGVPDLIAAGTRSVEHLAEECDADAKSLHRLLR